jgi:cell filamentation protein
MTKGGAPFCHPENIERELARVFGWLAEEGFLQGRSGTDFAGGAAYLMAELNAIHAFREGNGRTQNAFLALLAVHADHPLDFEKLDPAAWLAAMIESFGGADAKLARQIEGLVG